VPIPDYESIMLPLLRFANDGKEHSFKEAVEILTNFHLTEEEKSRLYPTNKASIFYEALTYLKHAGLLIGTRRRFFKITQRGENVLKENPNKIDDEFLSQFPEFVEFLKDVIKDTKYIPKPESLRRGLVFGTGFSLLLISIVSVKNMWEYFIVEYANIYEISLLIFSAWGISYVVFLWFSFLLIGFKNLRGCAWAAIRNESDLHICVDSVLNARQDKVQAKNGISVELLKTDGSRLWTRGLLGLLVFAYVLTIDSIDSIGLFVKLIFIGSFSSLYFLYDRTIHTFSKHRKDLTGEGDYPKLVSEFLHELARGSLFKKS
jgi:hypothetical protein